MSELMPYIVAGLATGAIYGLSGTGLVLSYKTSGIFNFAQPALAAVAAYVFYFLHFDTLYFNVGLSWPVSAAIAILVAGPLMGLGMEVIVRGLAKVATTLQVLATIGLSLGVIGALGLFYRNESSVPIDPFLPITTFRIFDTNVGWDQFILFVFAAVSVVVLYLFFRYARLGMAMRAIVDNPELIDLTGESAVVVSRWAWIISAVFAAASGVLLCSVVTTLSANTFFSLMIASFGAAAIGIFKSLPLTFIGGLGLGIAGSLSTKYVVDVSWLSGLEPALPFIVLLVVLIAIKPSKLVDTRVSRPRPLPQSYYAPWRVRIVAGVLIVTALAFVPAFAGNDVSLWAAGLVYMILILSLGLLVKESGQVSLCQTAFAAVGGVAFAHAAAEWGFPWFVALLFSGIMALIVGLFVAIPAIRVAGVFLALATLGFGLALQNLFYPTSLMFTHAVDGLPGIPRPSIARGDNAYYYLLLAFAVAISLIIVSIHYGRLGRLLRGLADSPLALNTMGDSINATRVIVFAISAFIAGIAGALYASFFQAIGLETPLFQPLLSLQLFAIVMLVAAGTPWYGLFGGLALFVFPNYLEKWLNLSSSIQPYLSLVFGVSAVLIAIQADRRPALPKPMQRVLERFRTKRKVIDAVVESRPRPQGVGLGVEQLTVRFGGIVAVDQLDVAAPFGRITGLIGPNGAGKTTTFNAASGILRPSGGRVRYNERDISRFSVARRARLGIGRTFQQAELWDSLSVRENVSLGREAPMAGSSYPAQLAARPSERRVIEGAANDAMELAGITDIAEQRAGDLSTGQRRLVELARVLAGPFDLLLLDEPSSGLDRSETAQFGAVLQRVVRERGTGVLLVEHDMTLVMDVCEYIYVMDFGRKIYDGTPADVNSSEIVRAAYLGSDEVRSTELSSDLGAAVAPGPPGNGIAAPPAPDHVPTGDR